MHGQFIWYELTTPDVDAAKKFYPRFTGWGTQPFDNDYTMWTTDGVPIGGLFQLSDEMRQQGVPPNWMPYVESNDVDDTVAKATSLGAQLLHGPEDIPGAGRIAVLQDPQGAAFGVYKSTSGMSGWDGTASVGRFSWHELMTTDRVAAFEFYRALFGWEKNGEMDMGGGEIYSMYGHGQNMYGGMFNATGDMAGNAPVLARVHQREGRRQGSGRRHEGGRRGPPPTDGHPRRLDRHPRRPTRRWIRAASRERPGTCGAASRKTNREESREGAQGSGELAREGGKEGHQESRDRDKEGREESRQESREDGQIGDETHREGSNEEDSEETRASRHSVEDNGQDGVEDSR